MDCVRFMIPGKPMGKGRPRFDNGHAVTPKKTRQYEVLAADMYRLQSNGRCWMNGEPLSVFIRIYYDIPKSYTKKRIEAIKEGLEVPVKKPDIDNCVKIVLDALNGVAWKDDTQVVSVTADKFYTDDTPYVFVSVSDLEWEDYERKRNDGRTEDVCQINSGE